MTNTDEWQDLYLISEDYTIGLLIICVIYYH